VHGIPIGLDLGDPLPRRPWSGGPRQALDEVLRDALARPPCLVSFSGGRDSSAMLGVATEVARRRGLPLPIPATLVFPGSAATDEDRWQSTVLRHLRIDDRVRIVIADDQLDAVGPVATAALRRHGLLWPFNTHFHQPIIERAAGGSVVTGFGGDELALLSATARAERILTAWRRPRRRLHGRDLLVAGLALAPVAVRRTVHGRRRRRELADQPWLTPEGRRQVAQATSRADASIPLGWEAVVRTWIWRDRYFHVCIASFDALGADHGTTVVHPFVDERVLDALAADGGFAGLGDRTTLMNRLFADVLPAEVVARPTKASFTDPLWTQTARHFAASWSGAGVDHDLVDADALRRHWAGEERNLLSTTLLQQAWLHDAKPVTGR